MTKQGNDDDRAPLPRQWLALLATTAAAGAIGALVVVAVFAVLIIGAATGGDGGGGTTAPPTTPPAPTTDTTMGHGGGSNDGLAALDNPGGLPNLAAQSALSRAQVDAAGLGAWMSPVTPEDNGPSAQGQFRLICTASHLRYDDPIIFPGEPGAAHLHLFFGNTSVDALTTEATLMEAGGSTCQGGPLNRSGYWVPAMLDGAGSVVLPEAITLYYKSHRPADTDALPQFVQMLAGNIDPGGTPGTSFTWGEHLSWGCYTAQRGFAVNLRSVIPGTAGTAPCPPGESIRATVQFPQCFAVDGQGNPVLASDDFLSHTYRLGQDPARPNENQLSPCPATHPYRTPQITYLIDWANPGGPVSWRLSSDPPDTATPGGSLHGDWWGGWTPNAIDLWQANCIEARRNCSLGQTSTPQRFDPLTGTQMGTGGANQTYVGPQLLPLP